MDFRLLSKGPLFEGVSPEDIEKLFMSVPYKIKKHKVGSLIAQSGDIIDSLKLVMKGIVKGEMTDYAGRVIKIEDIPAPGAIAAAFLFGSKNRFPVNVIAVTDCELFVINKEDFLKLLKGNDRILINFLNMISNRSQFLSEKIKFLNFKTIKGKLAHLLLQKAGRDLNSIHLDVTQGWLADFFGVARPSVARALGILEEEGYLEVNAKNIKILDKKGLADLTLD